MTDQLRIREGDALSTMQTELCRQALNLKPYDADERVTWLTASRQLLGAVRDTPQRMAWAIQLATAFAIALPGAPIEALMGELLVVEQP
jgi:hypothetical protein